MAEKAESADNIEEIIEGGDDKVARARAAVNEKIEVAKGKLSEASQVAGKKLQEVKAQAGEKLQEVKVQAGEKTQVAREETAEGLKQGYERVRKDMDDLSSDVNAYVRDNPGRSVLMAAGIGFVLGILLRPRR